MPNIHPKADVSPQANLGRDIVVGPYSVVESGVTLGDDCRLASHVVIREGTTLGDNCQVAEYAVLGGMPQHVNVPKQAGTLQVGSSTTIREYCTLHRSLSADGATRIGDHTLIMVGSHVGHDCTVGSHVILTNDVMLGGHVEVQDRAYLGGGGAVHQFCRIGQLAMIGGFARIKKDVPPYVMVDDATSQIVGLNVVGLRRNGFSSKDIEQLKAAYRVIYRSGLTWREVLPALEQEFPHGPAAELHRFLSGGKRGFVQERRAPSTATIRLHRESGSAEEYRTKAG